MGCTLIWLAPCLPLLGLIMKLVVAEKPSDCSPLDGALLIAGLIFLLVYFPFSVLSLFWSVWIESLCPFLDDEGEVAALLFDKVNVRRATICVTQARQRLPWLEGRLDAVMVQEDGASQTEAEAGWDTGDVEARRESC